MEKIEATFRWDDIVLPSHSLAQLRKVASSFTHRHTVYSDWGFEQHRRPGRGITALFAGPSGTGKTMAAQVLANDLSLALYRIDLPSIISKYIGETEKNLDRAFRMTQSGRAILFFDEADALFSKRTGVRDAHDRYANVEVAYLMQRIEEFDGMVVMTTNLDRDMDEALLRRMQHVVEFPLPDAEHRTRIWEKVFPSQAPLSADMDFRFLGKQFDMTGGDICQAALGAAFLAADGGGSVTMEHVVLAVASEMKKAGRLPSESDFEQYGDLIRSEYGE